jgi:hypothetical protein
VRAFKRASRRDDMAPHPMLGAHPLASLLSLLL